MDELDADVVVVVVVVAVVDVDEAQDDEAVLLELLDESELLLWCC